MNKSDKLAHCYECLANCLEARAKQFKNNSVEWRENKELAIGTRNRGLEYCRIVRNDHLALHLRAANAESVLELYGLEDPRSVAARAEVTPRLPKEQMWDCSILAAVDCELKFRQKEEDWKGVREMLQFQLGSRLGTIKTLQSMLLLETYTQLGEAAYYSGDYEQAVKDAAQGLSQVDWLRTRFDDDEGKRRGDLNTTRHLTNFAVGAAARLPNHGRAFDYLEQYKGRALLDLLAARNNTPPPSPPEPGTEQATRLARIEGMEAQLDVALKADDEDKVRSIERDLLVEHTNYERLKE